MDHGFLGLQSCRFDENGTWLRIHDRLLHRLGHSRQTLCVDGGGLYSLLSDEGQSDFRRELRRQADKDGLFSLYGCFQTKQGDSVRLLLQGERTTEDGQDRLDFTLCEAEEEPPFPGLHCAEILHSLDNPVIISDNEMRILFLNHAAEKSCGFSLEQCLGQPCSIFHTPNCCTENCCIRRYLRGDPAAVQRDQLGREHRVMMYSLASNGKQCGYISISTDITELVQTEKQLKLSEERYRIALAQTKNSLWEYDVPGDVLYISDPQADDHAPRRERKYENALRSLVLSRIVHKDSRGALQALYDAAHRGERQYSAELQTLDEAGQYRWMQVNCTTVFDEDGTPARVIGVAQDVTEVRAKEQQYSQERQYRASIASDAMNTYEANLTRDSLVWVDPTWAEILQISSDASYTELLQSSLGRVVVADHQELVWNAFRCEALLQAFQEGRKEVGCEYLRRNKDGAVVWVSTTAYLIRNESDGDVCAFIHIKDVDEQKKKELALLQRAERDPLTGLYNKGAAQALAERYLPEATPVQTCALFIIDIDNFKQINDRYGHLGGDVMLSDIAAQLQSMFRSDDVIGRIGGDEFLIVMRDVQGTAIVDKKAESVLSAFGALLEDKDDAYRLSCSIGISLAPQDGSDFLPLYRKADAALYHAKTLGKNRFAYYTNDLMTPSLNDPMASCTSVNEKIDSANGSHSLGSHLAEYVLHVLYQTAELEAAIPLILEIIGRQFDISRVYVFEDAEDGSDTSNTFEWCGAGVPPQQHELQHMLSGRLDDYYSQFDENGIFYCRDIQQLAPEHVGVLERQGIKSMLQCVIRDGGRNRGFVGFDECRSNRFWTQQQVDALSMIVEIMSTFLFKSRAQRRAERTLQNLEQVLDHQDDWIYVIDKATCEILYANQKTFSVLPALTLGDHCFRVFFGTDQPCEDCPVFSRSESECKNEAVIYSSVLQKNILAKISSLSWFGERPAYLLSCREYLPEQ